MRVLAVVLAVACALSFTAQTADAVEPIEEAFGLRFGSEYPPSGDPEAYTTLNGARAYYFTPDRPSPLFSLYLVQITPITHLIHTVIAIGPGPDLATCLEHRSQLMPGLIARYGSSFTFEPSAGPSYEKDYEIILQADQKRGVGVTCGGNSQVVLQIIYVDDVLSDLAELERLQIDHGPGGKLVL